MEFYNENIKLHYIKTLNGVNEGLVRHLFKRLKYSEELYNKDICDFVPEEIEDAIYSIRTKSVAFLKIFLGVLFEYTNFCTRHNYRQTNNINYFQLLNENALSLDRFIDRDFRDRRYMLPKDLVEISNMYLANEIDKVMMEMLWLGFSGKEMCQMISLKHSDVDSKQKILPIIDEHERTTGQWYVTDRLINYIESSKYENQYISNISDHSNSTKGLTETSPYVFKSGKRKDNPSNKLSKHGIYGRYDAIKEMLSIEYTKISSIGFSNPLYLGLLLKYIDSNLMEDTSAFYRMLLSLHSRKNIASGKSLQIKIQYNIINTELTEDDIDKDLIQMYVNNLGLLQNVPNVNRSLSVYINKVINALKTVL